MGRFSALVSQISAVAPAVDAKLRFEDVDRKEAPERTESHRYVVDNSLLHSKSSGLRYRTSPMMSAKDTRRKPVAWNHVVEGILCDGGRWLQVGDRFLPVYMGGVAVLLRLTAHGVLPPDVGCPADDEDSGHFADRSSLPKWMLGPQEPPLPAQHSLGPPPGPLPGGAEAVLRAAPGGAAAPRPGRGQLYAVVSERAVVRRAPLMDALMENFKLRGTIVELFEWDDTREWRRCLEANANEFGHPGWMRIQHPSLGQLLCPLEPLCVAVVRGDAQGLRRILRTMRLQGWRGASGCHPVSLAIERGALPCCAALARHGGDFARALDAGCAFPWDMDIACAKALIAALSGKNFDLPAFERALETMPAREREVAEQLFDQVAQMLEKVRSIGDGEDDALAEDDEDSDPEGDPQQRGDSAEGAWGYHEDAMGRGHGGHLDARDGWASEQRGDGGVPYRVVYKHVFIRKEPEADCEAIGARSQGAVVLLFEFDRSGRWRRVAMGTDATIHEPRKSGWMLLQHPALGVLLEPVPTAARAEARGQAGGGAEPGDAADVEVESDDDDAGRRDGWAALFDRR